MLPVEENRTVESNQIHSTFQRDGMDKQKILLKKEKKNLWKKEIRIQEKGESFINSLIVLSTFFISDE